MGAREIRYFVLFPPDACPRRRGVPHLILFVSFDYICHVARVPTAAEEPKKYIPKTRPDPRDNKDFGFRAERRGTAVPCTPAVLPRDNNIVFYEAFDLLCSPTIRTLFAVGAARNERRRGVCVRLRFAIV